MSEFLPVGKLDFQMLRSLLDEADIEASGGANVVVGPGIGRDVAVLDIGAEKYLLAKTDPITFVTESIGHYLVNVNTNDIATSGGRPRWLLVTLLLPDQQTTAEMVEDIFRQISDACEDLDIALVGGHTEITHDLNRPLVVGLLLGEVERDRLVTPDGLREGDAIIVTKQIPVEGTALIALEKREELRSAGFSDDFIDSCADLLHEPGIAVLDEALAAVDAGEVHAMHDPTEGGLATGIWEMADAAGLGMLIRQDAIPIRPEARKLCNTFGLDPLGVIASGSLLIGCPEDHVAAIVNSLDDIGIPAALIGHAVARDEGVTLTADDGTSRDLPRYDQDELTAIL